MSEALHCCGSVVKLLRCSLMIPLSIAAPNSAAEIRMVPGRAASLVDAQYFSLQATSD